MDVAKIVEEWLRNNGYTGLCTEGCGCSIDDLFPCAGCSGLEKCEPGYAGKSGNVYPTQEQAEEDKGFDDDF